MGTRVKLEKVRLAFIDALFVAKEFKAGDGKFRYSATPLVEPGSKNDKALHDAIKEEAVKVFGAKADAKIKEFSVTSQKFCYTSGDGSEYDGFEGMMVLRAHRRAADGAPKIRDKDGTTDLTAADGRPYGGCYGNVWVDIYAMKEGNPGIFCSLVAVQFHSDGDAFSGNRISDDEITPIEDGADTEDLL